MGEPVALVFRREDGVGDAGDDEQFAAARAEGVQNGADGVVNRAGLVGFRRVAVEVEGGEVEVRVVRRHEVLGE